MVAISSCCISSASLLLVSCSSLYSLLKSICIIIQLPFSAPHVCSYLPKYASPPILSTEVYTPPSIWYSVYPTTIFLLPFPNSKKHLPTAAPGPVGGTFYVAQFLLFPLLVSPFQPSLAQPFSPTSFCTPSSTLPLPTPNAVFPGLLPLSFYVFPPPSALLVLPLQP